MARKTNTTIKSASGKSYGYCRISRMVEKIDENTGEISIIKKQFCGKSQAEALSKLDAWNKDIEARKEELSKSKSEKLAGRLFGESVKTYIDNTFIPDSSIKKSTKLRYINSYLNIFDNQDILRIPLKDVCGEDIQAVFTKSAVAPSSKEAALKLLRNYYKYASAQHIAHDVTQNIVIPKAKQKRHDQEIEVYTTDELNALLDRTPSDHRLRFLIVLAIETGCRIGELLALTYSDIDTDSGQITINKSLAEIASLNLDEHKTRKANEITTTKSIDSVRTLPITAQIRKELSVHRSWHKAEMLRNKYRTDNIFTTKNGELYFPSNTRVALRRLCIKIGVEPKGWHAFRHTYGSDLAAAGVPIQDVCKLMGHSDISVTAKYYVNISSQQKKQAADKLEEYRKSKAAAAS